MNRDWMLAAACIGQWDLFDSDEPEKVREAKAICWICPVRIPCAQMCWSDPATVKYGGTWAGTTAPERLAVKRWSGGRAVQVSA